MSKKEKQTTKKEVELKKPTQTAQMVGIEPGNIDVLTVRLLDAINKNLIVIINMLHEIKEK